MRAFCNRHKGLLLMMVYMVFYLAAFGMLEKRKIDCTIYESVIDRLIPFCKVFVIPYFLWFLYIPLFVIYFDHQEDRVQEYRLNWLLVMGMTIFLVISAVYPNEIMLRPRSIIGSDISSKLLRLLYFLDTPTNVLPSIHVYNTMAVMIALWKNKRVRQNKVATCFFMVIGVSIILSTMLIKQHSVIDVVAAVLLVALLYPVCYGALGEKIRNREKVFEYRLY